MKSNLRGRKLWDRGKVSLNLFFVLTQFDLGHMSIFLKAVYCWNMKIIIKQKHVITIVNHGTIHKKGDLKLNQETSVDVNVQSPLQTDIHNCFSYVYRRKPLWLLLYDNDLAWLWLICNKNRVGDDGAPRYRNVRESD